ncbi:MAG: NADPH-dependent oxidoreductase [Acidimicrobiia bacterium]|nr:NADPH-dependent oxidoreductase [Acidimicrobiia bacterium]
MTTPVIDQIHRHVSVRRFSPEPVSVELVETIVAAAQRSATSSNLQMYSVVAVTDAARRARLAELCGQQAQIAQAPVFLAWCADRSRLDRVCRDRGYTQSVEHVEPFLVAAVDVAILMQTATLAAESLGLGGCYIGAIRNDPAEVIELLQLPRLTFPIAGMTLGRPEARPEQKPRLATSTILHWETYDDRGEEEALAEYDRVMAATGIYQGRRVPVPGGAGETEDYGWMEHSARRVSQPQRTGLRQVLRQQGFDLA